MLLIHNYYIIIQNKNMFLKQCKIETDRSQCNLKMLRTKISKFEFDLHPITFLFF